MTEPAKPDTTPKPDPTPAAAAKPAEPTDATVKIQLDMASSRIAGLESTLDTVTKERDLLKTKLLEVDSQIEADLKSQLKQNIKRVLACDDTRLKAVTEGKTLEDLNSMLKNLSLLKADAYVPYTSIKAGDVTPPGANLTVGNLYGMKQSEILAKKGEF